MTTYAVEEAKKAFRKNMVVQIGSDYFADQQPDSGLTIDADKLGILKHVRIAPTEVDVREAATTIDTFSFELLDLSGALTDYIGLDATGLMGKEVVIHYGRVGVSLAFSDYRKLARGQIAKMKRLPGGLYSITCSSITARGQKSIFMDQSYLTEDITETQLYLPVEDLDMFPASGIVKIGSEFIHFSGKDAVNGHLVVDFRAHLGSEADTHDVGEDVFTVTVVTGTPMDLVCQLLISSGGTGAYDVLDDGCGIDASLVDTTAFQAIQAELTPNLFTFYLYQIENALQFIQSQILLPTGARIFAKDGKISGALINTIPFGPTVPSVPEADVIGTPDWQIDADTVLNNVLVKWNYDEGTETFQTQRLFTDQLSIAAYGLSRQEVYEFKALMSNGYLAINEAMTRLLYRYSTPRARVGATCQWIQSGRYPGDTIQLNHRYLPRQGGGLGMIDYLETVSQAINPDTGDVVLELEYASYSGIRYAFIAPSAAIVSAVDQKTFTVTTGQGANYLEGFSLKLFDPVSNTYYSDVDNVISSVSGDVITMTDDWTTTLAAGMVLSFSDYDKASYNQKFYGYICADAGLFASDGTKAYQILF